MPDRPRGPSLPSAVRRAVTCAAALLGTSAALCVVPAPSSAAGQAPYLQRRLLDSRITESSGLARSGYDDGVLWTHNDRGDSPRLFAVRRDGTTAAVVRLDVPAAVDWEAISRYRGSDGRSWLYVGDIGDNDRVRSEVRVHRVAEPTALYDRTLPATTYRLRYPDGRHDAEALLVHPQTRRVYVVTKDGAGVYVAPDVLRTDTVNVLRRVSWTPRTVTDGAFLADGRMVLRNYTTAYVSAGPGQPQVAVGLPGTSQGESLAVAPGSGAVLVGSEGSSSPVYWQPLP